MLAFPLLTKWHLSMVCKKLAIFLLVTFSVQAHAQFCPATYASKDREAIRRTTLSRHLGSLSRMDELCLLAVTADFSLFMIRAINWEYRLLRQEMQSNWASKLRFQKKTRKWLQRVDETGFRYLNQSELDGADLNSARKNAADACRSVRSAWFEIAQCF